MGPLEKQLLSEFAVYLIRSCSREAHDSPAGSSRDFTERRRWFARAYREWQLTPRVELAGRSPYEAINAERAGVAGVAHTVPKPSIDLYTDLPTVLIDTPAPPPAESLRAEPSASTGVEERQADAEVAPADPAEATGWRRLADRLFGSWLDDRLDRL